MRNIPLLHHHIAKPHALEKTARFEAFTDGVMAILITLLILQVHVPSIHGLTNDQVWQEVKNVLPQLWAFAVSFVLIAIFWVNHEHFTQNLQGTDYRLLWRNNFLLFWLALLPFTTAFLGDNPTQPVAVAVHAMVLCLATLAFGAMTKYAYENGLMKRSVSEEQRTFIRSRSLGGVIIFALAAVLAPFAVHVSLVILVLVPLTYFAPVTIGEEV